MTAEREPKGGSPARDQENSPSAPTGTAPVLLCSNCFVNVGLRLEAERIGGAQVETPCPHCGKSGGRVLDSSGSELLLHRFFVRGSIPPEIGGDAPLYQFNPQHYPGRVLFSTELDGDLRLLSEHLQVGLFHYGPALWRLGYTDHYNALTQERSAEERERAWTDILSRCEKATLRPGQVIFRVRKSEELIAPTPSEFDTPPTQDGRYDITGFPVLYAAEDVETCLHECRVTLADYINVAALTPQRELSLLDLQSVDDSAARNPFERVAILLRKFAYSGHEDYNLCRELASRIKAA